MVRRWAFVGHKNEQVVSWRWRQTKSTLIWVVLARPKPAPADFRIRRCASGWNVSLKLTLRGRGTRTYDFSLYALARYKPCTTYL